jgi:hypothetical protein
MKRRARAFKSRRVISEPAASRHVDAVYPRVAIAASIYETTRLMLADAPEPLGWPDVVSTLLAFAEEKQLPGLLDVPRPVLSAAFILAWASRAALFELERALLTARDLPAVTLDTGFVDVIWRGVILHYQDACVETAVMLREHGWRGGWIQ